MPKSNCTFPQNIECPCSSSIILEVFLNFPPAVCCALFVLIIFWGAASANFKKSWGYLTWDFYKFDPKCSHWTILRSIKILMEGDSSSVYSQYSLKPPAKIRIFLGKYMENGASWLGRWIFLRVSRISPTVSWIFISQAS